MYCKEEFQEDCYSDVLNTWHGFKHMPYEDVMEGSVASNFQINRLVRHIRNTSNSQQSSLTIQDDRAYPAPFLLSFFTLVNRIDSGKLCMHQPMA